MWGTCDAFMLKNKGQIPTAADIFAMPSEVNKAKACITLGRRRSWKRVSATRLATLAVRFTDEKCYFVSEAAVCRLLKAHDLITSPAYVMIKAADQFHTRTTRPNEMWQTDFTCFKIIGWGGFTCRLCSTISRAT